MEHIAAVGFSDDGGPSLAGCWLLGAQLIAAAVDAGDAPEWVDEAHPLVVAYVGATGDPQVLSLPLEAVTAAADGWAEALDAAGANDRLRAFTDAVDWLIRHDNPHGHALNQALAVELAGRPLTLEPLARRLLPPAALAADPGAADAAYPPGLRRTTTARSTRISLAGEEGEAVVDALRQAFHDAARLGLGPDASLGDIMQAQGVDPDEAEADMLAMLEAFDPAAAYAWLATDGLILTEENMRLVDPADARRWQEAGGAYQTLFEHADRLLDAAAEEDDWFDARNEAAGIALDELGACIDDGAIRPGSIWSTASRRIAPPMSCSPGWTPQPSPSCAPWPRVRRRKRPVRRRAGWPPRASTRPSSTCSTAWLRRRVGCPRVTWSSTSRHRSAGSGSRSSPREIGAVLRVHQAERYRTAGFRVKHVQERPSRSRSVVMVAAPTSRYRRLRLTGSAAGAVGAAGPSSRASRGMGAFVARA